MSRSRDSASRWACPAAHSPGPTRKVPHDPAPTAGFTTTSDQSPASSASDALSPFRTTLVGTTGRPFAASSHR
jgi:hypothetical protein